MVYIGRVNDTMNKPIGKVLDKANTKEFSFVATEYFEGDFVKVQINYCEDKDATLVGEVVYKEAINPYFDKPTTINYLNKDDESITSWNLYIAKVKPIGVIETDGKIKKLNFPPPPGTNVYSADDYVIRQVLELKDKGAPIGYLKQLKNLRIKISEELLCRTHFSILGRTGSGKSFFAKGLLKGIKDRNLIIFSPTEEYNKIAENINAQKLSKRDLLLPLNTGYIASIYGFTLREQILFENLVRNKLVKKKNFSNRELAGKISVRARKKDEEQKVLVEVDNSQKVDVEKYQNDKFVSNILTKIRSKSLSFSYEPMEVPFSKSTIIDMSDLEQESQEIIIMYVLERLLETYKDETKRMIHPKLIVVIEEAHNFAPSIQTTSCKSKIIQLAREGRKLGISLCFISQRPRYIDQTVLSQCGSLFLFNMSHPNDIEHVFGISPIYRTDLIESVRELMVGECLVIGDVTKYPLLCSVNFDEK